MGINSPSSSITAVTLPGFTPATPPGEEKQAGSSQEWINISVGVIKKIAQTSTKVIAYASLLSFKKTHPNLPKLKL